MDLIRSISWISSSHLRLVRDDDSHIDRLSHRYTVAICVLFAIIVSTKQYAGDPIDCWVPAQFKASYEKYADSYCWIAGSWYTPMDKELPLNERERRNQRIRYYQWVPFLLLFQAILCYIPRIIWRSFNVRSGLDLVNLVDAAIKYESVDKFSDREKIMAYIVRNIERYIGARKSRYERLYGRQLCISHQTPTTRQQQQQQQQQSNTINNNNNGCCSRFCTKLKIVLSTICFWTGKRLGNYLVVLYMFVKTLWLTNAISQLFLLNRFIGNDYHAFGLEIIEMLLSGQEWHEMRHFPRVTYCDFKIREYIYIYILLT
jgi:innexin